MTTKTLTEADWATAVEDTLDLCRWRWVHFRPGRTTKGKWATQISGTAGWPDYFAIRGDRAVAVELKRAGNRPTPDQSDWIAGMRQAGIEAHVITMPTDWDFFMALTARDPVQTTLTGSTGAGSFATFDREQ